MGLEVKEELCTGCCLCALACSFRESGRFSWHKARIAIDIDESQGRSTPRVCRQCPSPADCESACPTSSLKRSAENGFVLVDPESCTGCGLCVEACVHGAMSLGEEEVPRVCDLCGGEPACTEVCYPGALRRQAGPGNGAS